MKNSRGLSVRTGCKELRVVCLGQPDLELQFDRERQPQQQRRGVFADLGRDTIQSHTVYSMLGHWQPNNLDYCPSCLDLDRLPPLQSHRLAGNEALKPSPALPHRSHASHPQGECSIQKLGRANS